MPPKGSPKKKGTPRKGGSGRSDNRQSEARPSPPVTRSARASPRRGGAANNSPSETASRSPRTLASVVSESSKRKRGHGEEGQTSGTSESSLVEKKSRRGTNWEGRLAVFLPVTPAIEAEPAKANVVRVWTAYVLGHTPDCPVIAANRNDSVFLQFEITNRIIRRTMADLGPIGGDPVIFMAREGRLYRILQSLGLHESPAGLWQEFAKAMYLAMLDEEFRLDPANVVMDYIEACREVRVAGASMTAPWQSTYVATMEASTGTAPAAKRVSPGREVDTDAGALVTPLAELSTQPRGRMAETEYRQMYQRGEPLLLACTPAGGRTAPQEKRTVVATSSLQTPVEAPRQRGFGPSTPVLRMSAAETTPTQSVTASSRSPVQAGASGSVAGASSSVAGAAAMGTDDGPEDDTNEGVQDDGHTVRTVRIAEVNRRARDDEWQRAIVAWGGFSYRDLQDARNRTRAYFGVGDLRPPQPLSAADREVRLRQLMDRLARRRDNTGTVLVIGDSLISGAEWRQNEPRIYPLSFDDFSSTDVLAVGHILPEWPHDGIVISAGMVDLVDKHRNVPTIVANLARGFRDLQRRFPDTKLALLSPPERNIANLVEIPRKAEIKREAMTIPARLKAEFPEIRMIETVFTDSRRVWSPQESKKLIRTIVHHTLLDVMSLPFPEMAAFSRRAKDARMKEARRH